jgi:hypothetical protein
MEAVMTKSSINESFTPIEIAYLLGAIGVMLKTEIDARDRMMLGALRDRLARHVDLSSDIRHALGLDHGQRLN